MFSVELALCESERIRGLFHIHEVRILISIDNHGVAALVQLWWGWRRCWHYAACLTLLIQAEDRLARLNLRRHWVIIDMRLGCHDSGACRVDGRHRVGNLTKGV